ncbi:MAG: hypothetical protein IIC97_02130 [Chloroflexi bacterium]|nr:hypothetical protein [Chloroflexota bacterium]
MKKILAALAVFSLFAATSAFAGLPLGIDTAFTDLSTDLGTLVGYATTAAIALAVAWKVISMIKKGIGRV